MASPTGRRADAARFYFERERRRYLETIYKLKVQGYGPSSPFALGFQGPQPIACPNSIALPGNCRIALQTLSINVPAQGWGVQDTTTGEIFLTREAQPIGHFQTLPHFFREGHLITGYGNSPGLSIVINLYIAGPRSNFYYFAQGFLGP